MPAGIVLELQRDCLNADVAVSDILRKSKAIAVKLGLADLVGWIDQELGGYECPLIELPSHRKGRGSPKFWNPYNGYCPILTGDEEISDYISTVYLSQGVGELEALLSLKKGSTLLYKYPTQIQNFLQSQMDMPMECSLHFSTSLIKGTLDHIRNSILNWTLELEANGIVGEGFTFNADERREAAAVTNHIYGGNIGVVGNVAGNAKASRFTSVSGIDRSALQQFLEQVNQALPALPETTQAKVAEVIGALQSELDGDQDEGIIERGLASLRTVLEGASGNLVAQALLGPLGLAVA